MDKNTFAGAAARLQIPVSDKNTVTELSGDFVLPDYQPEIKRLLKIGAAVLPPSKYISDREAELAGNVDYYVFYIGSDNAPYCAPLTAEYKITAPMDEASDVDGFLNSLGCGAVIYPDMISGRVTAPRKLNIKCRLKSRVQVFGELAVEDGYSHGEVIFVGDDYGTGGNDESVYRSDFGFICIDDYRTLESKLAHLL